jgi:hypothetical protein
MKIGVIVDNLKLARWQADALAELRGCTNVTIYNCLNSPPSRKRLKHLLYYALNLVTVRNRYTRASRLPDDLPIVETIDFAAEQEGSWQRLPETLLRRIAKDPPHAIIKFGMGLLRVPADLAAPILSYHHGDPAAFRGRPAGFYELLQGQPVMGQIVQILSNTLDAGSVVAFADTKVHRHSYRATLEEAYRHSRYLLQPAIENAVAGRTIGKTSAGKVYRLPSNLTVARFLAQRLARSVQHLFYGAFMEKRWQVSTASVSAAPLLSGAADAFPAPARWKLVEGPKDYRFFADPFFHPRSGGLLLEALSRKSNKGEILHFDGNDWHRLSPPSFHFSYPGGFEHEGSAYLLPETADWSPPRLYRMADGRLDEAGELDLPGRPHLLDATLHASNGMFYLFANVATEGSSVLRLWMSPSLHGPFLEHPASPVRVSAAGSRMAGSLIETDNGLVRIGQDARGQYGDGILFFRVDRLNSTDYSEALCSELRFADRKGPHTLNFSGNEAVFDWYADRFSMLAGWRRLNQARLPDPA